MICHVVIVAESAGWFLLSSGTTEFLICGGKGLLYSIHLDKWSIKALELTLEDVSRFVVVRIFVLQHFGLPFVHLWTHLRCASVAWRLLWLTKSSRNQALFY